MSLAQQTLAPGGAPPRAAPRPIKAGFVVGPTGIGKSALAIAIAERLGAEIVNADSRQLYRGMDIGTAKPGAAERARVAHHLIDVAAPDEPLDVARFRTLAHAAIASIAERGRPVLISGGSGLYLRVLRQGIFRAPAAAPELRRELLAAAARDGGESLVHRLREVDPEAAARLHRHDLVRIVRALEVFALTGTPLSRLQHEHGFAEAPYESLVVGLTTDRDRLYRAIDERLDAMMAAGLVEEVKGLLKAGIGREAPAMGAIGYREIAAALAGELTMEEAVARAKRESRRLAKRQMTWFRRDPAIIWLQAGREDKRAIELFARFFARDRKRLEGIER